MQQDRMDSSAHKFAEPQGGVGTNYQPTKPEVKGRSRRRLRVNYNKSVQWVLVNIHDFPE